MTAMVGRLWDTLGGRAIAQRDQKHGFIRLRVGGPKLEKLTCGLAPDMSSDFIQDG
jgi:hypothetical protein